jgi:hypothetical protein
MTNIEKIEAIKALTNLLQVVGTFAEKVGVLNKITEIVDTLDPTCKCKQKNTDDICACKINPAIFCNSTADTLSLPGTTPAS